MRKIMPVILGSVEHDGRPGMVDDSDEANATDECCRCQSGHPAPNNLDLFVVFGFPKQG